jgi:chromatin remodeling complex protein RSC6
MSTAKANKQNKPAAKKNDVKVPVATKDDNVKPTTKATTTKDTTTKDTTTKASKKNTTKVVEVDPATVETPRTKQRKVVDRDSVLKDFDSVVASIDSEIENMRENKSTVNTKFLRSLNKNIKLLRTECTRMMKKKTERKNNSTSGFLKPVNISTEMAKFTGWDAKDLRSRVEVTKYVCDYIKEHDLQNPEDRREIMPDAKLQKLLGLEPKDGAIKYYSLQTHLKKHFPKKED